MLRLYSLFKSFLQYNKFWGFNSLFKSFLQYNKFCGFIVSLNRYKNIYIFTSIFFKFTKKLKQILEVRF